MFLQVLRSKIHGAMITSTNVDYEGSIGLPASLKRSANFYNFERVYIYNVTNGARYDTYLLPEDEPPGQISVNGAAARLSAIGDIIIIVCYVSVSSADIRTHRPLVVISNESNEPISSRLVENLS